MKRFWDWLNDPFDEKYAEMEAAGYSVLLVYLFALLVLPIYAVKYCFIPLVDQMISLSTPGGVSWADLPGQPVQLVLLIHYFILSAALIWQFIELRKFSWRFFLAMAVFIIVDSSCYAFVGLNKNVSEIFIRLTVRMIAFGSVALYFFSLRRFFDPPRHWAERRRRREEGSPGNPPLFVNCFL